MFYPSYTSGNPLLSLTLGAFFILNMRRNLCPQKGFNEFLRNSPVVIYLHLSLMHKLTLIIKNNIYSLRKQKSNNNPHETTKLAKCKQKKIHMTTIYHYKECHFHK